MGGVTPEASPVGARHTAAADAGEHAFTADPSRGLLPAGAGAPDPFPESLPVGTRTCAPRRERVLAVPGAPDPLRGHLPAGLDAPFIADPCHPSERPDIADVLLCRCGRVSPSPRETGLALLRAHPGCRVAAVHGPDGRGVLATPRGLVLVTPVAPAGGAARGADRWGTVAAAALVYAWLVSGRDPAALPDTVLRSARNPSVPPPPDTGGDGAPAPEPAPVPGGPPVHEVWVRAEPR
ncbi:hypothetical protein A9R04_12520 [Nocardiopsis dassonvillei]|nr:hypothetical protein A9R04_12520 [Nocardiopsis dassonvillei]